MTRVVSMFSQGPGQVGLFALAEAGQQAPDHWLAPGQRIAGQGTAGLGQPQSPGALVRAGGPDHQAPAGQAVDQPRGTGLGQAQPLAHRFLARPLQDLGQDQRRLLVRAQAAGGGILGQQVRYCQAECAEDIGQMRVRRAGLARAAHLRTPGSAGPRTRARPRPP